MTDIRKMSYAYSVILVIINQIYPLYIYDRDQNIISKKLLSSNSEIYIAKTVFRKLCTPIVL